MMDAIFLSDVTLNVVALQALMKTFNDSTTWQADTSLWRHDNQDDDTQKNATGHNDTKEHPA